MRWFHHRRGVRRGAAAALAAGWLLLTGCFPGGRVMLPFLPPSAYVPETVEVEGRTYRTGFYPEEMFLHDMKARAWTGEAYDLDGITYHRAALGDFDCLHASIGATAEGEAFCLDSQWEAARDFYNFTRGSCTISAITAGPTTPCTS